MTKGAIKPPSFLSLTNNETKALHYKHGRVFTPAELSLLPHILA